MLPAGYIGLFDRLAEKAKAHGYGLGLHGSLQKDMDIMAMPWTNEAIEPQKLIEQLYLACTFLRVDVAMDNQFYDGDGVFKYHSRITGPSYKPHGRLAWSIQLGMGAYLDISVMPRSCDPPTHEFHYEWCRVNEHFRILSTLIPALADGQVDPVITTKSGVVALRYMNVLAEAPLQPYRLESSDGGHQVHARTGGKVALFPTEQADKAQRFVDILNRTWKPT